MQDKKMVVFHINNKEYGIPGEFTQSIEKVHEITRVPFTESHIKGVFNMRGVVIPVLDLSEILATTSSLNYGNQQIIIVQYEDTFVGLLIDEAKDVINIRDSLIEPIPKKINLSHLFKGIYKLDDRLISILDIGSVLFPNRKED